ncbi:MAG: glycosyltransferase [Sandaracinaceae bacterium]
MKLFVTVGAQMPFDRLIRAVDSWAGAHPRHRVRAQIGETDLVVRHCEAHRFLQPAEFDRAYDDADAIVGHAGIGTLFAAMERGTPIAVLPRQARLRETRNDHQIATARRFESRDGVLVAWTEAELPAVLDALVLAPAASRLAPHASAPLLGAIARFIDHD